MSLEKHTSVASLSIVLDNMNITILFDLKC